MKPDTIVRMFSMTKAVTGVAAMMLYHYCPANGQPANGN
jgi:hypothetical protein